MPYYCTVPRCTSMAGKAKNVSFHQFPRDEELARLWNDILKRGKPYTKYSKVCSLHFKPEDYTITSVGKNKGQWRTLRKDAVPSQNLPMETPAPYSRKQWETWSQKNATNVMESSIHQQMATAIYMQTMLAMQAAGTESLHQNGPSSTEAHTSNQEDVLKAKQKNADCTYKCTKCTKCFKDPDVFLLHRRSHTKDIKTNGIEKENLNLTLRSNPILANLLKSNNEVLDSNMVSMENLLMTALAANMDYLRNISTIKDERECDGLNYDENHASVDRNGLNHSKSDPNHDKSGLNHDKSGLNHDKSGLNHDKSQNHIKNDSNSVIDDLNRLRSDLSRRSVEIHIREDHTMLSRVHSDPTTDRFAISSPDHITETDFDNSHLTHGESLNHETEANPVNYLDHLKTDLNHDLNRVSYAMDFTSKKINQRNQPYNGNYCVERKSVECVENGQVLDSGVLRSNCDNDLNESMDSTSLMIDEGV